MIHVDKTLPINPDKSGAVPILSRDQVWRGLMMKVNDARPFVPLMSKCEVTERLENGLLRDIVFDGMALAEKITFYPQEKVAFERVGEGAELGTIWNEIIEDDDGELHLRFAFELEVADLSEAEEQDYRDTRASGYLAAVNATLELLRNLARTGKI